MQIKKPTKTKCHSAQAWGVCSPVTRELIKLDSLWMLSPSCCLCKQLGETEHFNGRLCLQLIRCTLSGNSLFHCFLLWFYFHIHTFLTTWQLNLFFFFTKKSSQMHTKGNIVVTSFKPQLPAFLHSPFYLVLTQLNCKLVLAVFTTWNSWKCCSLGKHLQLECLC